MINERVVGRSLAYLKGQKALFEALRYAQWRKNEREMVLVFHQNGRSTVSASLIAPGSRLVGFGPIGLTQRLDGEVMFPDIEQFVVPIVLIGSSDTLDPRIGALGKQIQEQERA